MQQKNKKQKDYLGQDYNSGSEEGQNKTEH